MIPIKNAREIEAMRVSGAMAREILEESALLCVPGLTTRELDRLVAEKIKERGAESAFLGYRGFPGNCCICIDDEVVHGFGKERRLQYGEVVKLDIGIRYKGWIGDTAMSVAVGAVSPEVERLMQVTEESLLLAISKARAGARVGDVSAAVERHVTSYGYSVVKEFVGHGVGKRLHEEPQIPNFGEAGKGPKLKPGMTIAIEPMVNMGKAAVIFHDDNWTVSAADGMPSAHFEHTILVTSGEAEILTCAKKMVLK